MPYGTSIADIYGSNTTAAVGSGGGAMGAPNQVQDMGQGISHLSLIAWVAMIGILIGVRVLWELSE